MKNYEDALFCIEKSIEISPEAPLAHRIKGEIFLGLDAIEEAKKSFYKAVSLDKKDMFSTIMLGYYYFNEKNYKKSILYFDKALVISPNEFEPLIYKTYSYIHMRDFDNAKSYLSKINELYPDVKLRRLSRLIKFRNSVLSRLWHFLFTENPSIGWTIVSILVGIFLFFLQNISF